MPQRDDIVDPDLVATANALLLAANHLASMRAPVDEDQRLLFDELINEWRDLATQFNPPCEEWPAKVIPLDAYRKKLH